MRDRSQGRIAPGAATLWGAALIIVALILTQASRFSAPGVAYAGNVSEVGDLVVLTAGAGNNEDVLVVMDSRSEKLLVYSVDGNRQLQFLGNYELGQLFTQGRQSVGRRGR